MYLTYVESEKNADIICYNLRLLASLLQANVKNSKKLMNIDENS